MSDAAEPVEDYPRAPVALACHDRVLVEHAGEVLADTTRAVRVLERSHLPVFYVPCRDVRVALTPSERTSWCEWKGHAVYLHVRAAGWWLSDAAWGYADPSPGFETLRDHVAFCPSKVGRCTVGGEVVVPQAAGPCGGWITSGAAGPFGGAPGTAGW